MAANTWSSLSDMDGLAWVAVILGPPLECGIFSGAVSGTVELCVTLVFPIVPSGVPPPTRGDVVPSSGSPAAGIDSVPLWISYV